MDAHLVFDGDAAHIVTPGRIAVGIEQVLGHDEQRQSLDPGRRVRQTGQHQVHDIGGQVVLAIGDEDLLAEQLVAAVGLRFCAGAGGGKVRAGLRLGEVHGAGPLPAHHLVQPGLLLLLACSDQQGLCLTDVELGQHRERHVGGEPHLPHRRRHQLGQSLPAEFLGQRQPHPASLAKLIVGGLPAVRRVHRAVLVQSATLQVALLVDRCQHTGGKLAGLFHDGRNQVRRRILATRKLADLLEPGQFGKNELHVPQRGLVVVH